MMINQYQPLDSGIHYFQTNPNQKAIRFFPRPPPADRTNRPISSLKCYRLTIWFWKKRVPQQVATWSTWTNTTFCDPAILGRNLDFKPQMIENSATYQSNWIPPTGLCRISRQTLGDEPVKFSRYATVCRNLEWTCSSCPCLTLIRKWCFACY